MRLSGVPNFYATTIYDGRDYASVLVKTREGRPIKIEANKAAQVQGAKLQYYRSMIQTELRNLCPVVNLSPGQN